MSYRLTPSALQDLSNIADFLAAAYPQIARVLSLSSAEPLSCWAIFQPLADLAPEPIPANCLCANIPI